MVRRNNKSTESTIVFTRGAGDNSLWDDADLIRLWNAQLEEDQCGKAEDEAPAPSTVSEDGSLITTEDDEVAESEQKSSLRSFQSGQREAGVASAIVTAAPINASVAPVVLHQSMFDRLPADIRQLLVAYFNAGYEAGYFVGKRDGSSKVGGKRARGE
ncbi:survival of motor neuron (SMN)-like protein [Trypanosoma brucei equiperdum]|uniref:Survival of motor neuron (SMN)-like protein n=1 Tax=Trypanosoma brucei equiperdum TaxID=630700 RepID=A0A3L6KUP8_9TRYP|nr:survival of motor neuron (SMN)-like protein [Trypanosoma brucei equiperdum]